MATIVNDTFTDSDSTELSTHTGETGATWTKHVASAIEAEIVSNELRPSSTGSSALYLASGTPGNAEYDVECDVKLASETTYSYTGVVGRFTSVSAFDGYLGQLANNENYWRLTRADSGSFTDLGQWYNAAAAGTHTLKLELLNATKKVWVNGTARVTSADNTHTGIGQAGVRTYSPTLHHSRIDNFVVTGTAGGGYSTHWAVRNQYNILGAI